MNTHTRIISLFLSFWMLLVSTGFSLSLHYCGENLEDWSILSNSSTCSHHQDEEKSCHEEEKKSCCADEKETVVSDNCCKSSEKTVLLEEDFNLSSFNVSFSSFILVNALFIVINSVQTNSISEEYFKSINDSPPVIIEDIPVFVQSFLI